MRLELNKSWLSIAIVCGISLAVEFPASAQIAANDRFTATKNCPAVRSIRTGVNPGNIVVSPKITYPVVGKNHADPTHYLIEIDGAKPNRRWVEKQCGVLASEANAPKLDRSQQTIDPNNRQQFVLAVSWQPAFCESKPNKPECKTQTANRFDADRFTLHGLWPEGREYCGVNKQVKQTDLADRWDRLPPISLSTQTSKTLAQKMPGFASNLQLHEWYKHGTCYGTTPERYFQDALRLLDALNNSQVRFLFANNIDRSLTETDIRASFERSFGVGAGKKVTIECYRDREANPRNLISELQINIAGKIDTDTPLANAIVAGKNTRKPSCARGEVDRVGID